MIQTVGAFLAVVSFAFILELPRKFLMVSGAAGALGWLVYLMVQHAGKTVIMAAFVSSLLVAFVSHLAARYYKAPVTVFLVAGILPSVPGASIYRSVYYVIHSMQPEATSYLLETLQIAGAIAMAIFIMDSLFRLGRKVR